MPLYEFRVRETVQQDARYVVEAENEDMARELAACGETVEETERRVVSVIGRDVLGEPVILPEDDSPDEP